MTKQNNLLVASLTAILGILFATAFILSPTTVSASDKKEATPVKAQQKQDDKKTEEKAFKYTAQPGDSFSLFARKAVQTYGVNNNVKLSPAQIIFAETTLTQAAGSPILNLGEVKAISHDSVKDVVEKATKLTDAQKKAWEVYTVGVNFNTDKVGEVRK